MLILISPAKTLDFKMPVPTDLSTEPVQLRQSRQLIKRLRELSADDFSTLMKVSRPLAELNLDRVQRWKTPFTRDNARQALFAFRGDVYLGLDAYSMSTASIDFAQNHLRILSGLYGLLRPLDLIQPYRLEMGTRLETSRGTDLYQFWGDGITRRIGQELASMDQPVLVNLASIEYFKSVKTSGIKNTIVHPVFKEYHRGKYQVIGLFAKRARGLMARYIIDSQITEVESIKDFDLEGYAFDRELSRNENWVFSRRQ